MIFIVVKFTIKDELADRWLDEVREFTEATRAEPGNLFFEWSKSVETPNQFVLVEGFADPDAGAAHVGSDHFKKAIGWMPDWVTKKPDIISHEIPVDGWSPMGEITPR